MGSFSSFAPAAPSTRHHGHRTSRASAPTLTTRPQRPHQSCLRLLVPVMGPSHPRKTGPLPLLSGGVESRDAPVRTGTNRLVLRSEALLRRVVRDSRQEPVARTSRPGPSGAREGEPHRERGQGPIIRWDPPAQHNMYYRTIGIGPQESAVQRIPQSGRPVLGGNAHEEEGWAAGGKRVFLSSGPGRPSQGAGASFRRGVAVGAWRTAPREKVLASRRHERYSACAYGRKIAYGAQRTREEVKPKAC